MNITKINKRESDLANAHLALPHLKGAWWS